MRKYVIYNQESKLSVESAQKCIEVAKNIGKIDVEMWNGISRYDSKEKVQEYDLSLDKTFLHLKDDIRNWTQHSFEDSVVGCFLSHYSLWKESIRTKERILILEHDALFTKKFEDFIFEGVLNLGKPIFGNDDWKNLDEGLNIRKPKLRGSNDLYWWGSYLHGAHSYIVTPKVSEMLVRYSHRKGISPTDTFIKSIYFPIADLIPFCTRQNIESNFTLIQKPALQGQQQSVDDEEISKYGDDAWK